MLLNADDREFKQESKSLEMCLWILKDALVSDDEEY